ncbi:hypothetical protein TheveDRAFT_1490 [Thermanaerovibrio velox DSM 12556]|uniref:Uncharacterized protein n=1 Tax=Thermanaerovibrio velox DSM 12556 TaxID=926567 RepID=H0UPH7_9BACT|nr:hypothetical protein [Thermanaerovibrio velox]EHM10608.1 hypothetical protein TheveDRAFT_1490 [Thermanaerovibrio velox DSM 12556]
MDISRYLRSLFSRSQDSSVQRELSLSSFGDLWALVPHLTEEEEVWVLSLGDANYRLAQRGILKPRGRALGYRLWRGAFDEDPIWVSRSMCGAALDLVFSGEDVETAPVVESVPAGVLLTVPMWVLCNYVGKSRRSLAEALSLGGLVAGYMLARLEEANGYDRLIAAAAGCAAGLARLSDGSLKVVERGASTVVCLTMGDVGEEDTLFTDYLASVLAGQAIVACQMALSGQGFTLSMDDSRSMFEHWISGRDRTF